MSGHLKNIVLKIIKENSGPLTVDDILNLVKNMPQYQRTKLEALKPTIKKIFQEIKKEKEKDKEINSENNQDINDKPFNNSKSLLNKKRNLPINKMMSNIPLSNSFNPEKFLYKSSIKLSSLGGMTDIVKRLTEIISNPLNYYQAYKEINTLPIKGILLCGPPGCGKTTLAYSIGGEFQIPFYKITGPDIISSLSGESEQIIRNLFNSVIENAPSILFIDEIETIIGRREQANKEMERRIVAQIMTCIDDINDKQLSELNAPVFVIGATSKPEFIDSSMRRSGRFDVEIHIGFPTIEMREEMIISITKNNKISKNINFKEIAKKTPGYLAADLQSLARSAGHNAINRLIKANKNTDLDLENLYIEQEDFNYALTQIQPTSKREGFTTIPNITWDDIGGLKELREELYYDIVLPIIEP